MTKIVVRLPEPKKEYSEDNQRQINRVFDIGYRTIKLNILNRKRGGKRTV